MSPYDDGTMMVFLSTANVLAVDVSAAVWLLNNLGLVVTAAEVLDVPV